MAAFPDPPIPFADERVGLRLAADRDIPEVLIAHQDDPALSVALGERRPPSGAELGRRVEESAQSRRDGIELWLTITDPTAPDDDLCRGQLDVTAADPDQPRVDLRIWIVPADRRRGLATAALALAGRWLIEQAGRDRVELLVPSGPNATTDPTVLSDAARGAGYRHEGALRGQWLGPRGRIDAEVHSLVAGDLGGD